MAWQVRSLIGLVAVCLTLLSIAGFVNSPTYRAYETDLEDNRRECQAERNAESGKKSKECQTVLYRVFDDPVALLTGGLFIATIGLFIATYFLYDAAVRQGEDSKRAVAITRETSKTQLRAYLSINDAIIYQMTGRSDLIIQIKVKNFGQTPAYKVRSSIKSAYAPANVSPYDNEVEFGSRSIVGPTAEIEIQDIRPLTVDKLETVVSGTSRIFVWGTAEYEDAFGENRFFKFRARSGQAQVIYAADGVTKRITFNLMPSPDGYEAN